jgi:hypothetical protein
MSHLSCPDEREARRLPHAVASSAVGEVWIGLGGVRAWSAPFHSTRKVPHLAALRPDSPCRAGTNPPRDRADTDADHAWELLHAGANGDLDGALVAAAAVVAFRRTPTEIAKTILHPEVDSS